MHQFSTILILGALAFSGCSADRKATIFSPWGWEDAADAKSLLSRYKNVFVVRVDECTWEDRGPHRLTPWHYKATVTKTYKGDWRVSERLAFVHYVDAPAPAPSATKPVSGGLLFIFTSEHTNAEIGLDTGEWGHYRDEMAPALEYLYPQSGR